MELYLIWNVVIEITGSLMLCTCACIIIMQVVIAR